MKLRHIALAAHTILALAVPGIAYAHPQHADGTVFSGLMHPLTGLDHMLAMILVGAIAAHIGGRALCLVPLSFVAMMILGAFAGLAGTALPYVELGIAASLIVFGLLVASGLRAHVIVGTMLAGAFAVFHGYAHGAEMPADAGIVGYAAGFLTATVLLHVAGLAAGIQSARMGRASTIVLRAAGAIVAAIGFGFAGGLA